MEEETLIESGYYNPDNVLYHLWTCVGAPGNLPLRYWNDVLSALASSLSVHIKHGPAQQSCFDVRRSSYQNIIRRH